MPQYCCVEGCGNGYETNEDPNAEGSFFRFPQKHEMKMKWLQAIGLPEWEPPSDAKVCNVHFDAEHIICDPSSTLVCLSENAYPVHALPSLFKYEHAEVEVCRICLATDLKMYRLKGGLLKIFTELTNISEHMVGLPDFLCYECTTMLVKCSNLIEKSLLAQTTLLEIYAENGQITKNMIKELDRKQLNLASPLRSQTLLSNVFEYKYDHEQNCSQLIRSVFTDNKDIDNNDEFKYEKYSDASDDSNVLKESELDYKSDISDYESDEVYLNEGYENDYGETYTNYNLENESKENVVNFENAEDANNQNLDKNSDLHVVYVDNNGKKVRKVEQGKNIEESSKSNPPEVKTEEFFNVIELTPEEQIEEWNQAKEKITPHYESVFECLSCPKIFTNQEMYQKHMYKHDPNQGEVVCPVCSIYYVSEELVQIHISQTHEKKYHCKACPKTFNNERLAKKHQKWHEGYKFTCARCPFVTSQEQSLNIHLRMQHPHIHICSQCGRTFASLKGLMWHINDAHKDHMEDVIEMYRCESCNVVFSSEEAKRIHLVTSNLHNDSELCSNSMPIDENNKPNCKKCGKEFDTLGQLFIHAKTEHPHAKQRSGYRLPTDKYPCKCEHCDQMLNSRREHYVHYVKKHPGEKYKPVILATCKICGKGYQSVTKLQIHELHHSSPTVRCGMCPRIFHDKYALTRHMTIHNSARPFQCSKCDWSFKQKCNLHRHELRVHSMERPYKCSMCDKYFKYTTSMNLHIRTVHYKIPLPPRKKRTGKTKKMLVMSDSMTLM